MRSVIYLLLILTICIFELVMQVKRLKQSCINEF